MAALTSLIHLFSSNTEQMGAFFIALSDVEPFISHAGALVDTLEKSNPEKQYFRALVDLARATSVLYVREEKLDDFIYGVRARLVKLLHAYRFVLPT